MYVTPKQLADQIGKPNLATTDPPDQRLIDCCESATSLIDDWCGRTMQFQPVPGTIKRVALSLAIDLWKQPDATFGIMGMGETGPVRVARDLCMRYDSLLIPYYDGINGWGVA